MKTRKRFYSEHVETTYMDHEDEPIWLHLLYEKRVSSKKVDAMLDAYQTVLHQHGQHIPICVQLTRHLEKLRQEIDIEETETDVWLADPIAIADYCTRYPVMENKCYLVSESLYHQMSESFKPTEEVVFESIIQSIAKHQGMYFALIE